FAGAVYAHRGTARDRNNGGVQYHCATVPQQRHSFLHREQEAFDIKVELHIEVLLGNLSQRSESSRASIRKNNIDLAFLFSDRRIQPPYVGQYPHVALHGTDIATDAANRLIQLFLPSPCE